MNILKNGLTIMTVLSLAAAPTPGRSFSFRGTVLPQALSNAVERQALTQPAVLAWTRSRNPVPVNIRSLLAHAWLALPHETLNGNGKTSRTLGILYPVTVGIAGYHAGLLIHGSVSEWGLVHYSLLSATAVVWYRLLRRWIKPNLGRMMLERQDQVEEVREQWATGVAVFGSARIQPPHPIYQQGEDLGKALWEAGLPVRTGAGPALMEAPIKGYVEQRDKRGVARSPENAAQGVRIRLPFEQFETPYLIGERLVHIFHFFTRKMGLHFNVYGAISLAGGYGSLDEDFEVLRRGRPLVLLEPPPSRPGGFWRQIFDAYFASLDRVGLSSLVPMSMRPFITDSVDEAVRYLEEKSKSLGVSPSVGPKKANENLAAGLRTMTEWPKAITFIGQPKAGSRMAMDMGDVARALMSGGTAVRVASRGALLRIFRRQPLADRYLQTVLFVPPHESLPSDVWTKLRSVISFDESNHQVFVTKGTQAFVFLPGGYEVMNILFDVLTVIQTHKIARKPIFLYPRTFWEPLMSVIESTFLSHNPPLISRGDERLYRMIDTPEELALALHDHSPTRSRMLKRSA